MIFLGERSIGGLNHLWVGISRNAKGRVMIGYGHGGRPEKMARLTERHVLPIWEILPERFLSGSAFLDPLIDEINSHPST